MAKNFPYFKFFPTEWMTGDIVFEDLDVQGLFINICALYWQRNADLTIDDINKRFKSPEQLAKLTDRFFSVNDGKIMINFLDEQLIDASHISKKNSENGSKGGRPKSPKTLEEKPTANPPLSEGKPKKSKEEEELNKNKNINNTTLSEVEFIFLEKTNGVWVESYAKSEADKFFNFYSMKGWMVGKNKMKSLGHAIGGWIARNENPKLIISNTLPSNSDEAKSKWYKNQF